MTLTIGARQGAFPAMLALQTFQVVLVFPSNAVRFSSTKAPTFDATIAYTGIAVTPTLK